MIIVARNMIAGRIEFDYPITQLGRVRLRFDDYKMKILAAPRVNGDTAYIIEVEDECLSETLNAKAHEASEITTKQLRAIVPIKCPECGSTEMRVFANTVMAGARLEFTAEGDLDFENEAREGIADLAWGYGCLDCDFRHYFSEEMEIDW